LAQSARNAFLKAVKNKKAGVCKAAFCKNRPARKTVFCWKCTKKWWRYNNLRTDRYNNLKHNAKRRGILFGLTFDEFQVICDLTGYTADGHLQFGDRMSLDRIKREKGYVLTNLRVISVRDNCRRFTKDQICVGGVWLDHECVSFEDDPLNDVRMQAVKNKIGGEMGDGIEKDKWDDEWEEPPWLREDRNCDCPF